MTIHVDSFQEILAYRTRNTIGKFNVLLSIWYANFIEFEDLIETRIEIVVWKYQSARLTRFLENDTTL